MNIVKRHCKLFEPPIEKKVHNEIAHPLIFKDIYILHVVTCVACMYNACVMVKLCYPL